MARICRERSRRQDEGVQVTALRALQLARDFVAEELCVRLSSYLPTTVQDELDDINEATALLATLDEAIAGEGWQPIESASKNGKPILVSCDGIITRAWWEREFDQKWDDKKRKSIPIGAWTDGSVCSFAYETLTKLKPTHWRYLPPAPTEAEEAK